MTGKTHLGIGVMFTVILSEYFKLSLTTGALVACALASLLPDIDHPKSFINQYILPFKNKLTKTTFYITLGVVIYLINSFYFNYTYFKILSFFSVLIGLSTHRNGLTHSLFGFICFVSLFGYAAILYGFRECIIPFSLGYIMHLIADMFTSKGIPIMYPFKKKKFKMPFTFKVGSWLGNIIESAIILTFLVYVAWRLPIIITNYK
ncbi:MAG: metal-dependent hydrolase [Caloramator sp.]|jgi:inner membrane protein|uniref:metal-dependent hydrolase n=1 Tax=Caloramator sp. TaxID=1871330 RepID=UPI001D6D36F1|nr:metal-dependent hydrolase [Caloramator sp.]MBZ4662465.1 metal-dependent hydrolase [Caloramator sp.]